MFNMKTDGIYDLYRIIILYVSQVQVLYCYNNTNYIIYAQQCGAESM